MELVEALTIKIILIVVSSLLGLILSLLASLMIANGEWEKLSNRTKWGHRLIGLGLAITVSVAFFASNTDITEQNIWLLFSLVCVASFSGVQGYKVFLKGTKGGD